VREVGEWEESEWHWCLRWRHARFECESMLEAELITLISTTKLVKEEKDAQVWRDDGAGCFTVNSAYDCLVNHRRGPQSDVFKYLWKAKAFPSVLITTWRVMMDRLPIRKSLSRRGVMTTSSLCAFCQTKDESCQHLFLECKYAMSVWSMCFRWIGILFVQHNHIKVREFLHGSW